MNVPFQKHAIHPMQPLTPHHNLGMLSFSLPIDQYVSMAHVDWSQLPEELLELIFIRLRRARDIIRFSAVCSSWSMVASNARSRLLKPLSPMLLLPSNKDGEVHHLFDFSENKAHRIPLPEVYGKWCCHSWNGWLVTITCFPPYPIEFLNLTSRAQIQLPLPETFQDPPPEVDDAPIECFIYKAIPSSNPSDPNCVFLAIHGNQGKLAFCKSEDKKWKTLKSDYIHYDDIIYYKNHFIAVGPLGVFQCDIGSKQKVTPFAPPVVMGCVNRKYLLESSGDLLLVVRYLDWEDENEDDGSPHYTPKFEVFKLDFRNLVWNELNSLGDSALFVGHNHAILVSTEDFDEFKSDCIYFLDDYREGYFEKASGCHDMGIFNLKAHAFEPMFQSTRIWLSPLFWIIPEL